MDAISGFFQKMTMGGVVHTVAMVGVPLVGMYILGETILPAANPSGIPMMFWVIWTVMAFVSSALLSSFTSY